MAGRRPATEWRCGVRARFWSDDFDMDLLKIFPDLPERIGAAADIPLWTHGGESHGRLNHPAVWPKRVGLGRVAYFGLHPETIGKPSWYSTNAPVIECTWLEALRDAWPHTYTIQVDDRWLWDTGQLWGKFNKLMFDLLGYAKLPDGAADQMRGEVLASILAATNDLRAIDTARLQAIAKAATS